MTSQLKRLLVPLAATVLMLIFLEVVSTALLPVMGFGPYRISFSVLLTLFMAFKLETPYLPFLILIMQYIHSFFSIGGWEPGTIAGVLICVVISYLKNIIHFTSHVVTIVVTEVFQVLWFCIVAALFVMKGADVSIVGERLWRFVPESLLASLMAPLFFSFLDKIWDIPDETVFGGGDE